MTRRSLRLWLLPSLLVLTAQWIPREAEACGGTFCDTGPNAMPVPQTGENILFVLGDGYTEAHIQIQYDSTTTAEKFAWVVPMLAVPEFSVGSQALFANALTATVPAYGFNYNFDDCGGGGSGGDGGDGLTSAGGSTGGEGGDTGGGPEVVLQQTVGAFEITVLQGGTAEEVMTWLGANGYEQDPNAEPILAEYLAENYMFAAFKLTNDADIGEIHPVTLTFTNDEACVPLRLTRIAAQDDMEVRTFFLASSRVVPQNYKHVLVNPLKLDWPGYASNYKEVITLAVDAFGADGKAFVTEYAGSSTVVSQFGIFDPSWDASAFVGLAAVDVVDTLASQGLYVCDEFSGTCSFTHALLDGLLAHWLPVPDGVTAEAFYDCLSCYEGLIDQAQWGDGSGFAADMQSRIVDPGAHAVEVLQGFPTLTRMYTTISPAEMTEDPFFWANPDLEDVDLTSSIATRRVLCNGDAVWTLPGGREVYVPDDGAWPDFGDEMPYEEDVAQTPENGAPIAIVDNTAIIDTQLGTWNCDHGWPANECGAGTTGADTSGGSASDGSASGGTEGTDGSSGGSPGATDSAGYDGCGCNSDSRLPASAAFGLVIAALVRPRRRRR
ncbi:MAG: DUF2330 domain-containing protein [Nannocystaceae bacterium]|nr:DUF2330 domain-containing protein [Nannocystaceae bacterium]